MAKFSPWILALRNRNPWIQYDKIVREVKRVKTIRVKYRQETPKNWSARSSDIKGYFAGAETLEELKRLVYEGIPFFVGEEVIIEESFEKEIKSA